jgi:hypothetical protein
MNMKMLLLAIVSLIAPLIGSGSMVLANNAAFVFATAAKGRNVLTQRDDFVQRMSPFDHAARLKTDQDVSEQTYLDFVSAQVREWSDDDKAAVQATLSDLRRRVNALGVRWPDPIFLVKTTGNEEGKAAYTRANAIVLPAPELAKGSEAGALTHFVAHELFHVVSRHDPTLKEKLYAAIGFQPCGEVTFPSKLAAVKITNPDAPKNDHCIRVGGVEGKPTWVAPILFAASKYDVQKGGEFFNYLQLRFLCLDGTGAQAPRPATYDQAAFRLVDVSDLSGFFEQVGHNTDYIIHPEEILADNFSLLMRGKSDVPSPDILKKIQGVLEQQKRR